LVLIKLPITGYNKSFARWLVLELAPTIYGHKPATILSLKDRPRMPWHTLWEKCGENIITRSKLKYVVLRETPVSKVIFFYHPENLENASHRVNTGIFWLHAAILWNRGWSSALH